jgi:hypothetical protein
MGELLAMKRRGTITEADFVHGLRKTKLETRWDTPAEELATERLDPAEIAKAIHRGILASMGLLVATPPTTPGRVPMVPQSPLDAVKEAEAAGIDAERLRVMVGNAGLPPGAGEMLQLLNRGEITTDDFLRGIGESNMRNEWGAALLNLRRRLLTPHEYQEAALRGVLTNAEADAGSALSGLEPQDAKTLFDLLGRPLPVHAITTGLERGGTYGGSYDTVPEPYRDAIRRSSIRPEYAHLAYANRYSYPSAFVIRSLATSGALTPAETHQTLLDIGWPPDFAQKVADAWHGGTAGKADPHVTKAGNQLWTAVHKAYVDGETNEAEAATDLTALGVAVDAQPAVIALWDHERAVVRRSLTPSQIKKAFKETTFTRDDALARLERLGMSAADAGVLLDE